MEENVINEVEERLKISIPVENVNKALLVLNYFKEIDSVSSQKDTKKALQEMGDLMHGGVSLDQNDIFQNWSVVYDICNLHRRKKFLELLLSVINKIILNPKEKESLSGLFYLMEINFYDPQIISMSPVFLEYAQKTDDISLIRGLEQWLNKKGVVARNEIIKDLLDKLYAVKLLVLKNKQDLYDLLKELKGNDNDSRGETACLFFLDTIKSLSDKKLIEYATFTKDFIGDGKDETIAIFSLLELIERYK